MVAVRFQTLIPPILRISDLETNTNQVTISSSNAPLFSTFTPSKKKPCIAAICSSVWFWPDMYVSIGILPCARNRWQFRLGQLMAYDLFCGDQAYDTTTCTFKKPTRPIQWRPRGHEVDSTRTPRDYHIALGLPFYDYSFYSSVRLIVKYMYEKKNNN